MQTALAQYRGNLKRASDLAGLAATLSAQTTQALDTSDLLRSAIVLAVSAFDHFIHEIARIGILEIASGSRPAPQGYNKFPLTLGVLNAAISHAKSGQFQWLDTEIRQRHGWLTFQDPDKVAEAIRYVSSRELWSEVAKSMSIPPKDLKGKIRLIVERRNKIAHEADMDPTSPGARWPITVAIVVETLEFLGRVASEIVMVVESP